MKVLIAAFVLASAPAWADWMELGKTSTSTAYTHLGDIRKTDRGRAVWLLMSASQGSTRSLMEFDCGKKSYRETDKTWYNGAMASGQVVGTAQPSDWSAVPPGTTAAALMRIACP